MAMSISTPITAAEPPPADILPRGSGRLNLRLFEEADADRLEALAGDGEVARWTANVPHPYPPGAALAFIRFSRRPWTAGLGCHLAVCRRGAGEVIGAAALLAEREPGTGQIGYLLGRAYWGRGYGSELVGVLIELGRALGFVRLVAEVMAENRASQRILVKNGFAAEPGGPRLRDLPVRAGRFAMLRLDRPL